MLDKDELIAVIEDAFKRGADKIRSDIQESMAKTPRNMERAYYTHNRNIPHHPSLPGNPPAPDSGDLRESIHWEVKVNEDFASLRVGSILTELYPLWLEVGTSDGRIAPRPWLRPAMNSNEQFVRDLVIKNVKKYIKENI